MRVPGPLRFARMAGSSIAAPGAAPWFTDFLNAAYYARPESERHVEDLRLAHGIATTRWSELGGRRLGAARGYVTCTTLALHGGEGTAELGAAVADLGERYAAGAGPRAPQLGAWDPLPPHLAAAYAAAGREAQHQFWGPQPPSRSMLAQLAVRADSDLG